MICVQYNFNGRYYYIGKKTFNNTIDEVIYNAPQGKNNVTSMLFSNFKVSSLCDYERRYSVEATHGTSSILQLTVFITLG